MNEIQKKAELEKQLILENMQTVTLSTVDDNGIPNSSYAPSLRDDNNNFFIYISELSKHTNNLLNTKKVSIMIIEDESNANNIFARKRFTMDADSYVIDRDSKEWISVITLMENKFGDSIKFLKNLTDFHLFKLTPYKGLLVHDFARAFRYEGPGLNKIVHLNEKGHSEKK